MPKYIFLDTWVLSDYTKAGWDERLADFVARNQYTIIITNALLTELYNNGWREGDPSERCIRAVRFLAEQHCVIVYSEKVWDAEFTTFPRQLAQVPVELDLDCIPGVPRAQALLLFLRRDPIFLEMGKDIRAWADGIAQLKQEWPTNVKHIIENALAQGHLTYDARGRRVTPDKEILLTSLDLRLMEAGDINLYLGRTSQLRGVRFSSLVFWHRYIQRERGCSFQPMPSDPADIFNMSLIPYCAAFTVDTKMLPTACRAATDAKCPCALLGKHELEGTLRREG